MGKGNLNTSGQGGKNTPFQLAVTTLLRMIKDMLWRIGAKGGSVLITTASGALTGQSFKSFLVREDTTVTTLSGGKTGTPVNYKTSQNIGSTTLTKGDLIEIPDGELCTDVHISGSMWGYK